MMERQILSVLLGVRTAGNRLLRRIGRFFRPASLNRLVIRPIRMKPALQNNLVSLGSVLATKLFGALLLFAAPVVVAETTLSVRLPVDGQQAEAREQAMSAAMEQVLVRLTGQEGITQSAAAEALLQRPERFMQRYQYELEAEGQLVLSMQFDGAAIRQVLAMEGVASWQPDRPPVLVWLALEQQGRRVLVGGEDGIEARALLQTAAAKRGVLLLFPLMDSEDQQRISPADVFGGFNERAIVAGERYGASLMAMGRMYREGSGWAARWSLSGMNDGGWNLRGATQDEVLDAVAAELATRLASQYAALPSANEADRRLRIQVSGVSSLRDFDHLQRHLRGLGGVVAVQPLSLEPDIVTLQLLLQTAPDRVLAALGQDRLLTSVHALDEATGSEQEAVLIPMFRLTP